MKQENKPKVETFTSDMNRKSKLITTCLQGYPDGLTPKLISAKTRINVNTVKSILPKLASVKKIMRGIYKVDNRGDGTLSKIDLFDWNFHNLVMFVPCDVVVVPFVLDCGLVSLSMSSGGGRAHCRCSSDFPLNLSSLGVVARLFADSFGVSFSDVMVSTVEFNFDYKNLRLDGMKCISVDGLVEQFKVYQKRRGLRVEHKTKVPLGVDSIVDMLSNAPNSVDLNVKLNEQSEAIKRLIMATSSNTKLMLRLSDSLKRGDF